MKAYSLSSFVVISLTYPSLSIARVFLVSFPTTTHTLCSGRKQISLKLVSILHLSEQLTPSVHLRLNNEVENLGSLLDGRLDEGRVIYLNCPQVFLAVVVNPLAFFVRELIVPVLVLSVHLNPPCKH